MNRTFDTDNLDVSSPTKPFSFVKRDEFIYVDAEKGVDSALPPSNDNWGLRYFSGAYKSLEDRLPFTAALVCLVGYIVMASFGYMDSIKKYLGYVIFIIIVFIFYKLLGIKNSDKFFSSTSFKCFLLGIGLNIVLFFITSFIFLLLKFLKIL